MEIELSQLLIICPLIFCAGVMNAVSGGGGLIGLPAFILAGIPMHYAMGTNKLSAIPGSLISAFRYFRHGFVDVRLMLASAAAALAGAAIGVNFALMLNELILERLLLIVIPVTAFYVFKNKKFSVEDTISRKSAVIRSVVISFGLGLYDGIYGPGVGTFFVLLYNKLVKLDIRTASGNAKCVNLAANITAMLVFLINGKIMIVPGLFAAAFGMLGGYIGAGLVIRNGAGIIRPFLLVVLTVIFIKITLNVF